MRVGGIIFPYIPRIFVPVLVCIFLYFGGLGASSSFAAAESSTDSSRVATEDLASPSGDPFEDFNRFLFKIHSFGDSVLLDPFVSTYNVIVPIHLRMGIYNVFQNLNEPFTFAHSLLQLDGHNAERSLVRILVNTTVGFGGIVDAASHLGVISRKEDLGQTLAVYGIPSGPYIVIPLMGGMDLRDAVGRAGDSFASPWGHILTGESFFVRASPNLSYAFVARAEYDRQLDTLQASSIDYYASSRDLYKRLRALQIRNIISDETYSEDIPEIPDIEEFLE